jgi:uncharacterized protein YkwD
MVGIALLSVCAPAHFSAPPPPPPIPAPHEPWHAERAAVVEQINSARAELGLAALRYDSLLERVGDAHCRILIEEGGDGHFSHNGVPPYLRWLLAGGSGFHRENVGTYSTTGTVIDDTLPSILARIVASMLAEVPPSDGHRRSLLDPWVTNIGIGLAVGDGDVRMTHELAVEVTERWVPPPVVAGPGTVVGLSGRLAKPWQPVAVKVLWEALPHPLTDVEARAIRSYSYPPSRAVYLANRPAGSGTGTADAWPARGPIVAPFGVDARRAFSFQWSTGPHEGVEYVLLFARHKNAAEAVPVAASATVVFERASLPPALAFWQDVGQGIDRP